jgi:hypothetical protein
VRGAGVVAARSWCSNSRLGLGWRRGEIEI